MSLYGRLEYWNQRYKAAQEPFEWYQDYKGMEHLIPFTRTRNQDVSREDCRVLILGCGNSRLGEHMLRDGWRGRIANVDYSPVVIDQMKSKYNDAFYNELKAPYNRACRLMSISEDYRHGPQTKALPRMEFLCADVTERLPFENGSFDLILCKGTLDAVLCSNGSIANAKRMMQECSRVLDDTHGAMVVVTCANPDNRTVFFENPGDEWWGRVDVSKLPQMEAPDKNHYVFVSHKGHHEDSDTEDAKDGISEAQPLEKSPSNEENDASVKQSAGVQTTFRSEKKKSYPTTKLAKLHAERASTLR